MAMTTVRKGVCLGAMVAALFACEEEFAEGAGEVLRDAGELIADAGEALADAGQDGASAQEDGGTSGPKSETFEVACDEYDLETAKFIDTGISLSFHEGYFATLEVDTANITGVDVILCNSVAYDPCTQPGATCSGSTEPRPPRARCVTESAEIGDGFVRTFCGATNNRVRYETARFTVRR